MEAKNSNSTQVYKQADNGPYLQDTICRIRLVAYDFHSGLRKQVLITDFCSFADGKI